MGAKVATIIVEPRLLVREALESLMANYSYRVVCRVGSTADIGNSSIVADGPKLVILGAQSADNAVTEAIGIRKLWPDSKIILLFEFASLADFQKLLTSEIDGCVPLIVSPDTLISTLDLIMTSDVRVMVVSDTKRLSIPSAQEEESPRPGIKMDNLGSCGIEHEALSITMAAMQHTQPTVNGISTADLSANNSDTQYVAALGNLPKMSEREAQILDGLVKGHANKVIARMCDITEATVKSHMKSILRKIRVANRTQAAIWALEHGYPADEIKVLAN
jgi:two-component system nitrate/nitrite response regulator NarL